MSDVSTCAMCGAPLTWNPGQAAVVCPQCGTVNERTAPPSGPWGIDKADIAERDLDAALAERRPGPGVEAAGVPEVEETTTVTCPGCGAEIAFDERTLAEACPFCATPLARAETHPHRHPKPQAVLPFALAEGDARASMVRWLGTRWFAPGDLKQFAERGRPLSGVYLPHYTYDARAAASYQGQRGDAHWVSRGGGRNRNRVRRVRWHATSGHVARAFDDVLVPASDTLTESGGESFAGWDLQALEPYSTRFLAGFRAELPTVELDAGWARARAIMERVLADDARRDIGGDEQRITHMQTAFRDVTFKHVLLPVWLAAYRYRGRPYRVVINARTGKVTGERPWSRWKVALAAVAGLILAAAILWLVAAG